ncbi:MAG TPA: transglycosylase SLT domain-containing protein [Devosiaceae bacterium]|nr:transglycosylase SLT domain-containing protein [Devosiaceae bacterium]
MAVTPISVSPSLASVLNAAGDRNDVDFSYLLKTATRESSLDPTAKSAGSSATGLFQFLDTTWLQVMKSEGPRLGYQAYADAITQNADGEYVINDPRIRDEVLKLRENPAVAADMAAAFTKSNGDYLRAKFGRMPSPGELYIAHFLGAQGAEKLFDAGLKNPDQIAVNLFPREAAANRAIFYDHGQPRTIRQVYKALVAQHDGPSSLHPGFAVQQMLAAQQPVPGQQGNSRPYSETADAAPIPSRIGPQDMSFTSLFSTEPGGSSGSPIPSAMESGQGAFFTQLYGQK